MSSPHWRGSRFAGCILERRALVLAVASVLVLGATPPIASSDDSGTTIHIRGADSRDKSGGDSSPGADSGIYEVGERDLPRAQTVSGGETIAGFALDYVGYPYAPAGNTPAGFDCAGFAQFVIWNALGVDIGHAIEGQPGAGAWVDWGTWVPGDLVFFQDTYRAGLSHVGIYIGDGLFIHAENEGTGVTVSSMYSDYYGPRYWGAVRPV